LPQAVMCTDPAGKTEFYIKAEKDAFCPRQAGSMVLLWRAPEDGNWQIGINVKNLGSDVTGGDGGGLQISFLPVGAIWDTAIIGGISIPASGNNSPEVNFNDNIKMKRGDMICLRFHAGIDGFGDQFKLLTDFQAVNTPGRVIPKPTPASLLPYIAETPRKKAVPIRKNLFWLGSNGAWAHSPYAEESIDLVRKFVPNMAVIMADVEAIYSEKSFPPAFYSKHSIPMIAQSWGAFGSPFIRINNAFEWDLWGRNHGGNHGVAYDGLTHAAAMPHPAFRELFGTTCRASVVNGYSGWGFCDMVWYWCPGRGASGHSPATIAAFRRDLSGTDEGLEIKFGKQAVKVIHFEDYVAYYFGGKPLPRMFGLTSWMDYSPLRINEIEAAKGDLTPQFLLFDMLVHYEWLKAAQYIGKEAQKAGGFFQCMPNPEDVANGSDFLFLSALTSVYARSEEYFNSPLFVNGAYYRFPYLRAPVSAENETGLVLESGGGGNADPYYSPLMAFCVAYELTSAMQADHLEADFWPSNHVSLKDLVCDPVMRRRTQSQLMYGLGFRYAKEDNLKKSKGQFVSFTSRRIFRPWGQSWYCWDYWLDNEMSPDAGLAAAGYNFDAWGDDGITRLDRTGSVVFYSPSLPTENSWSALLAKINDGTIAHAIVPAESLQLILTSSLKKMDFDEFAPEYYCRTGGSFDAGDIKDASGKTVARKEASGPGYFSPQGFATELSLNGKPVMVKRKLGKGNLHLLLFSPVTSVMRNTCVVPPASPDYNCGQQVWSWFLSQYGIFPEWKGEPNLGIRVYRNARVVMASAMRQDKVPLTSQLWSITPESPSSFSVKMKPRKKYCWLAFPSLEQGKVVADVQGQVKLTSKHNYQLFYLVPENDSVTIKKLRDRMGVIKQALSLDGRVPVPEPLQ